MTIFRRTSSGINNQHLFYNVDFIVFVEGGGVTYTKAQVYSGNFTEESNDILYWKKVFLTLRPSVSYKFKSVGSKTTIKDIALDIISGHVSTVIVAMDNEFDEVLGLRLNHKNIFYTYGYSWENDVWTDSVIIEIIQELSAVDIDAEKISQNWTKFLKKIKLAVYADAYLFSKNSSFFPRPSGYLYCVNCQPTDLPFIKPKSIEQKINSKGLKKATLYSFARRKGIETVKHLFGHFFADYCCQVIIHFLRNTLKIPGVNKEIIYRMSIKRYFQNHFIASRVHTHHEQQFNRAS